MYLCSAACCLDVKLINEVFQSLTSGDKRLAKVRLILLTPNCSLSAVSNPLEFILQENRGTFMCAGVFFANQITLKGKSNFARLLYSDASLLQDFSRGSLAQSKLEALIAQQREDIDHALKCECRKPLVIMLIHTH